MSWKDIRYYLILFSCANCVNIICLVAKLMGVVILRPIIGYEYFIIPVLIALNFRTLTVYLFFLAMLTFDMANQVSLMFLMNITEFMKSLAFISLYSFSKFHFLLLLLFIVFNFCVFVALRKLRIPNNGLRTKIIGLTFILFALVYGIDALNGKSMLNDNKVLLRYGLNLGTAVSKNTFILIKDLVAKPARIKVRGNSMTFKTFLNDSSGNQLLIIVESWGIPRDKNDWSKIKELISGRLQSQSWDYQFGTTPFKGGTVNSELRELFSASGDYHYLIDADSAKLVHSIFNMKKRQGYTTCAVHSYTGNMFQRYIWWKNIGIDSVFFLEDVIKKKKLTTSQLNYSTPFESLNDEEAFLFINVKNDSNKKFGYLLTENTHLPFSSEMSSEKTFLTFSPLISEEADNQLNRVLELLIFFAEKGQQGDWSKILIIGDHLPPFSNQVDRMFYSDKEVPYLLLRSGKIY